MALSLWFFLFYVCEDSTRNSHLLAPNQTGMWGSTMEPLCQESFWRVFEDTGSLKMGHSESVEAWPQNRAFRRGLFIPKKSEARKSKPCPLLLFPSFFWDRISLKLELINSAKLDDQPALGDPPVSLCFSSTGVITASCLHKCKGSTWVLISLDL